MAARAPDPGGGSVCTGVCLSGHAESGDDDGGSGHVQIGLPAVDGQELQPGRGSHLLAVNAAARKPRGLYA